MKKLKTEERKLTNPKKRCNKCKKLLFSDEFKKTFNQSTCTTYIDKVCMVCRSAKARRWRKEGTTRASQMYHCIHDPTGTYYNRHFFEADVKKTARDGYWPPGMIWLNKKTGTKYRIEGNEVYYYMERDLRNAPLPRVKQERQTLVRIIE